MVTKPNPRPRRAHVTVEDPVRERRIQEFVDEPVVGLAPPARKETASVGFNFKMTPTNHARLKRVAEHEGRSLQYVLNLIVWPAIAEREKGI